MVAIVAVDENWGIGCRGRLLAHVSEDLRRFKALTLGHPVILGRKTLATFPGGRPLPGRDNLIMSTTMETAPEGAQVFGDLPSLLACAPADSFVIGGETVYRQLLPYCDTAYVTVFHAAFEADAFFPDLDSDPAWTLAGEEGPFETAEGMAFTFRTYVRRAEPWA